jgi:hypothetical protein
MLKPTYPHWSLELKILIWIHVSTCHYNESMYSFIVISWMMDLRHVHQM